MGDDRTGDLLGPRVGFRATRRRDAWPSVVGISVTTLFLLLEMEDFRTNFFLKFLPATLGLSLLILPPFVGFVMLDAYHTSDIRARVIEQARALDG